MGIVLLCHAGVGVAELRGNHPHRYPSHCEMRAVGMTQDVEGHRRRNSGALARLIEGTLLVGRSPDVAVRAQEHLISSVLVLGPVDKKSFGFIGQHDVTDFPLAETNCQGVAVAIEVYAFQAGKLGVVASGQ